MQYSKSHKIVEKMNNIELKQCRIRQGLTQKDFCEKYKINMSTYQKWEQGVNRCPDYIIEMLKEIQKLSNKKN